MDRRAQNNLKYMNEPRQGQQANVRIFKLPLYCHQKGRPMAIAIAFVTNVHVSKGTELTTHYGDKYDRNYKVGKPPKLDRDGLVPIRDPRLLFSNQEIPLDCFFPVSLSSNTRTKENVNRTDLVVPRRPRGRPPLNMVWDPTLLKYVPVN